MEKPEYTCPYCAGDITKEVTERKEQVVTQYAESRSKIESDIVSEKTPMIFQAAGQILDKHMTDGEILEHVECLSCKKTFICWVKVKSGETRVDKNF
jgi:hypothetical protein